MLQGVARAEPETGPGTGHSPSGSSRRTLGRNTLMTWNETHERTRIIREVEAAAAADMTGAVPWREEWRPYFDGPAALVATLRARWHHMCEAQLDRQDTEDQYDDACRRLRRTQAAVLAILQRADAAEPAGAGAGADTGASLGADVLTLAGPRASTATPRSRRFHLRGGPVLPA